ncbi:MAG: OmpA family protein [Alphaproteobacteria bacterium]|nr:OmpA family protein [Alphaproteobacteria bacterium]
MAPILLLALTSCGLPADVVVLLPDEDGSVGKATVQEGGSAAHLENPLSAVNAGSEASLGNVFTAQRSDIEAEFAGALEAAPRAPRVYLVYFLPGSTELDPRSRGELAAASAAAKSTPNADISVVGHADATGSDAYNQALSLRRAQIVRDGLVAAGAPSEIVEIGYHGANNPLVPKPRGVPELRNRRVEVTIR